MLEKINENELQDINRFTAKENLYLTTKEISQLKEKRNDILKNIGCIEINGILEEIILEFCDSPFIEQSNYYETILKLVDIFYLYQTTYRFKFTDEQIIKYLRRTFDYYGGSEEILEDKLGDMSE